MTLMRTALYQEHQNLKGRLVDFGGWELPVQYTGVLDEHLTCREKAGLFDVSHMGEIHVEGEGSEAFLNTLLTQNVSSMAIGQAQYSVMCLDSGGMVDDLVTYRRGADRFLVVVNASNTEKDFEHFLKVKQRFLEIHPEFSNLRISNESARYSQIAIQGPKAAEILQKITSYDLASVRTYWFCESRVLDEIPVLMGRTGYTGEDGFEIYSPWAQGPVIWQALLEKGAPLGLKPCGLGARDTLRLEMKYPLYGNELTEETNPLEAGLSWVVKLNKESFVGKEALLKVKAEGTSRQLVGLKLLERGIPRHGYEIYSYPQPGEESKKIGVITSGTQSPSLKLPIAIAYVKKSHAQIGTQLEVDIRGTKVLAEIISTPFYKRAD